MKHFKLEVLLKCKIIVGSNLNISLTITCGMCAYNAHLIFLPFIKIYISNNLVFPF